MGELCGGLVFCDCGMFDGFVYWLGDEVMFFEEVGSMKECELMKYVVVIYLCMFEFKSYN
jgi:hypothetical protein